LLKLKNIEEALEIVNKMLSIDPDDLDALKDKSEAMFLLDEFEQAI